MSNINQIEVESTTYDIEDTTARDDITTINGKIPSSASSSNKLATASDIPSVTGKADKVSRATNGNFASLDSNGNLADSGHKHSDYLTSIPTASTETLGGVKVDGSSITINNGVISAQQGGGGTVTSVATGAGLTGGTITGSGTIKAKLKSETQSSLTAADKGSTANREYAVGVDASGNLSVNVPWTSGSQVQANWNETDTSSSAYIQNKPTTGKIALANYQSSSSPTFNIYPSALCGSSAIVQFVFCTSGMSGDTYGAVLHLFRNIDYPTEWKFNIISKSEEILSVYITGSNPASISFAFGGVSISRSSMCVLMVNDNFYYSS